MLIIVIGIRFLIWKLNTNLFAFVDFALPNLSPRVYFITILLQIAHCLFAIVVDIKDSCNLFKAYYHDIFCLWKVAVVKELKNWHFHAVLRHSCLPLTHVSILCFVFIRKHSSRYTRRVLLNCLGNTLLTLH